MSSSDDRRVVKRDVSVDRVPTSVAENWQATYATHAVRLTRLAVLLVGEADAHDLVTDSVWRAVTSRHWSRVENPGAYLTRSLVNLAEDRRRQANRRRRERAASPAGVIEQSDDDVERTVIVAAALAELSPSQLAVVFLHYWDDLTLDETAAELGLHPGTARTHLDRAKQRLRRLLPDFESEHHR